MPPRFASQGLYQGRSQKWSKEGVLRPKISKGRGFESAEAWQIHARMSFFKNLVKMTKKIGPKGGGVLTHISSAAKTICCTGLKICKHIVFTNEE